MRCGIAHRYRCFRLTVKIENGCIRIAAAVFNIEYHTRDFTVAHCHTVKVLLDIHLAVNVGAMGVVRIARALVVAVIVAAAIGIIYL